MKIKLLGTILLSSALILTACGQNDDNSKKTDDKKSESKSDKKSNDSKKDKKSEDKKKKEKENNKQSKEDNQQTAQNNGQNTNTQQSTEQQNQQNINNQKQEKPGTDAGLINPKDVSDESQSNDDQSTTKDVNSEINAAQTEDEYYNALRKKYHGGLSSAELQTKTAIEKGYYDGNNADQVYQKIQNEEQKIQNGEYDRYKN